MKIQLILINSLAILMVFWMSGCSDSRPSDHILSEEEMVDVLVDIHVADAILSVTNIKIRKDTAIVELYYNDVLNKHHTTQKQIENSIRYFSKNPKKFEEIYEQVSEKLSKMESEFLENNKITPDSLHKKEVVKVVDSDSVSPS